MSLFSIILLAFALAVDAFAVSFSYGVVLKKKRLRNSLGIATATGLGQFIMPILGFLLTGTFHHYIAIWDHWIAFSVFAILGGKIIFDAYRIPANKPFLGVLSFKILVLIGIATSIDALISGASLYMMSSPTLGATLGYSDCLLPALIIGGITFICAFVGFHLAHFLQHIPTKFLEIGAGLALIGIGVNTLIEHLL